MALGPHAENEDVVLGRHPHDDLGEAPAGRLMVAILTPGGPVVTRAADELVAPGVLGEFGVLPGHIPFLTAVKPGVLVLRDGQTRLVAAIGAGYVQVAAGNKVRVLAERVELADDIDVGEARADVEAVGALKTGDAEGGQLKVQQGRLAWAQAKIDAAAAASGAAHK